MKLKRFFSAISAVAISVCLLPGFSASAAGTVVDYTFDKEEKITVSKNGIDRIVSCYDDYSEPFLRIEDDVWKTGWINYDNDRNGVPNYLPTSKEMYIKDSLLNVNMNGYNRIVMRIPTSADATDGEERTYNIKFTLKKTGGDAGFIRFNVNGVPNSGPSDANPTGAGAAVFEFAKGVAQQYNKTVTLSKGADNYLAFVPVEKSLSFTIDRLTVTEIANVKLIKSLPAEDMTGVSTYTNPKLYFDGALDTSTISNIKLMKGDAEVPVSVKANSAGDTVMLVTDSVLDAGSIYTMSVPNTVKGANGVSVSAKNISFTTGEKDVVLNYDFEKEGNAGDCGIMYNADGWETSYELAKKDERGVLKLNFNRQWANRSFDIISASPANNLKVEGDNINRNYKISYDIFIEDGGQIKSYFDPYYSDNHTNGTALYINSKAGEWEHVEAEVTGINKCWTPFVTFQKLDSGSCTAYIDNLKITEIGADTGAFSVVSSNPENGCRFAQTTSEIEVVFNKATTEDAAFDNVELYDMSGDEPVIVETVKTIGKDKYGRCKLTVKPNAILSTNTSYALDLSTIADVISEFASSELQTVEFITSEVLLTGRELFYYDFESEYSEGDKGIKYGIDDLWKMNIERTDSDKKNGLYSLKVNTTGSGGNIKFRIPNIYQQMYVGKKYEISMDAKRASENTSMDAEVFVSYYNDGDSSEKYVRLGTFSPADDFEKVKKTFYIPEDGIIWDVKLYILCSEGFDAYLDNLMIKEIDAPRALIKYTNSEGVQKNITSTKMESELSGKTLNVTFDKFKESDNGVYKGIAAVYLGGKLIKAELADITVTGGAASGAVNITLPETSDDVSITEYDMKVFLWDSSLHPIIEWAGIL